ncbi:cryptochrome DASH [Citrus sinensis]|nr:cryptochrome DASH [Citrus sinensis]
MNIIASKNRNPNQNIQQKVIPHCQVIPGADSREINHIVEETFGRYTSKALKRNGKGVAIVWFRNDLRVLDNEALLKAWDSSEMVLPVYCVDPRHSQTTYHFGFPKTGALRAQFLIECLADLRKNLMNRGLNLLIRHGKPEEIIPSLAKSFGAHAVYAQKETCSEELNVERLSIEAKCTVRGCIRIPSSFGPPPSVVDWGSVPLIEQLELHSPKASLHGTQILIYDAFRRIKNVLVDTCFAVDTGSISPRYIYEEVKSYERERVANDSTYWVLFELMWRDYFRFISLKYGNSLFHLGGPRKLEYKWSQDQKLFESWRDGCTGYPLIDANMKELSMTGFMSNRGRQIACSFLVRDMGIDWRMGAEWFETCLLDYDPCSNYGNWTYGAGVGNDPREDRYFSIPKQAQNYDREGEYVAYWLPQLKALPKERRNFPGGSYIEQIVSLKHGNINQNRNQNDSLTRTGRRNNFKGKHAQVNR